MKFLRRRYHFLVHHSHILWVIAIFYSVINCISLPVIDCTFPIFIFLCSFNVYGYFCHLYLMLLPWNIPHNFKLYIMPLTDLKCNWVRIPARHFKSLVWCFPVRSHMTATGTNKLMFYYIYLTHQMYISQTPNFRLHLLNMTADMLEIPSTTHLTAINSCMPPIYYT